MIDMKLKAWLNEKEVVKAVEQAMVPRIKKCGLLVEADSKRSMKKGGRSTGPRGGKVSTPAPANQPPHVQTSNLRSSIHTAMTAWRTVVVGPTFQAWYGRLLEFGSRLISKHPFMRPALHRMAKKFAPLFRGLKLSHTPSGRLLNRAKGPL